MIRDMSVGAHSVKVRCWVCGKWFLLCDVWIDTEGPAFQSYYCDEDKSEEKGEA